ncbi:MAG: type II toxin-antitoxin system death-on-curing family toxin [Akkermansia sp.]
MILLSTEEIIRVHSKLINKTGGLDGLRDKGLLESAIASASNSFGDYEQYPTIEEKAARLAFAIVANHAFLDGNKRIGILVMLLSLRINQINLIYTQQELIHLGLALADGSADYKTTYEWILCHRQT